MDTLFELGSTLDEIVTTSLDLFNHPGFRLIFIDDNGNMSLEGPFNYEIPLSPKELLKREESRKKVHEYRCISHIWGTGDGKDHVWKDHPIKGADWKVEVREEKRERLLQIFNHHKGYFWMDVFCTNQEDVNKPLDVMGDIYRECVECVCLLDTICDVPGFDSEKELWIDVAKDVKEYMESDREHLGSKYNDLHDSLGDSSDISFGAKYLQYLESIRDAKWFQRVWTWQEAALPPRLLLCCEEAGSYKYDPYDAKLLRRLFPYRCLRKDNLKKLCKDLYSYEDNDCDCDSDNIGSDRDSYISDSEDDSGDADEDDGKTDDSKKLLSYYTLSDCIMHIKFFSMKHNIWDNVKTMVVSEKECTIKEDFVYGVTGILDITVPKELVLDEAVIELKKGLQKYGIVAYENEPYLEDPSNLQELYESTTFMDGFKVLEEVDVTVLGKFSTYLDILGYEEYKISKKDTWGRRMCYTCVYEISWDIILETDSYNVGDILKITKIGRKGCTFEALGAGTLKIIAVAKIVSEEIEVIGSIKPTKAYRLEKDDELEE